MTPAERAALVDSTEERLAHYIAAEQAVLNGQSYSIGNRSLDRADLREIRKGIIALRSELASLQRCGRMRVQRVVPRDGI